jgi:hypothetical protein
MNGGFRRREIAGGWSKRKVLAMLDKVDITRGT